MKRTNIQKFSYTLILLSLFFANQVFAQEKSEVKKVNFGYSLNPTVKSKKKENTNKTSAKKEEKGKTSKEEKNKTIAQKTIELAKKAKKESLPPTEKYTVGAGDVLFISLLNGPSNSAKYYTVLDDGTIDYPLAGELVSVSNLTTDEIEEYLREKIKLYKNPEVSVKVREHTSHKINVLGLVEKPGAKYLQRDAIPLFVIKAEAIVSPEADKVTIKRKSSEIESHSLKEKTNDDLLIFPGDIIEFEKSKKPVMEQNKFYYIGGSVNKVGRMDFYEGITLTQAIFASGGLKDQNTKKVILRRKNKKGLLKSKSYDLKDIMKGKKPDPVLQEGDIIEVE